MCRRQIFNVCRSPSPPPNTLLQFRGHGGIARAPADFQNDPVRVCAWHLRAAAVWG